MHEAVAALSPGEARRLVRGDTIDVWCAANGIPFTREILVSVVSRSSDPEPPPPPPPPNPRRHDEAELVEFVNRAVKLPGRLFDVAELCIGRGLTLDQAAERLGIKRNTVRSHLRRLRVLRRMVLSRR
jgi:DNA-directed RNA polymerase specialized sigma24 family protein